MFFLKIPSVLKERVIGAGTERYFSMMNLCIPILNVKRNDMPCRNPSHLAKIENGF